MMLSPVLADATPLVAALLMKLRLSRDGQKR